MTRRQERPAGRLAGPVRWLLRQSLRIEPLGPGLWDGLARYGPAENQPGEAGGSTFAFDTGGGTRHITQSLATVQRYALSGDAPDFGGTIGLAWGAGVCPVKLDIPDPDKDWDHADVAEDQNPVAAPHQWKRPSVGFMIPATFGHAHWNAQGELVLGWINEVAEQEACDAREPQG